MSIQVVFECDGCDAKAPGTARLWKRFESVSGRDYGFGVARWTNTPENVAPEGWVAADPYTYCTYCPKCWAEIEGGGSGQPERDSYATTTERGTEPEGAK